MKKYLLTLLTVFMVAMVSTAAHAITITINNKCITFVTVTAFAGKNTSTTKLGEETVMSGKTAVISTSSCVKSIMTVSTMPGCGNGCGTLSNYFYPTTCHNIKLNISQSPTACLVQFIEE